MTRVVLLLAALAAFALAGAGAPTAAAAAERAGGEAAAKKKRCAKGKKGKRCRRRVRCARRPARRRPRRCRPAARRPGPDAPTRPADPPAPGPAPGAPPPADPPPPPLGRSMSVTAREWSLAPSRAVLAAGTQTIELRNWGEDPHNLVIGPDDGSHTPLYTWPETPSLELFTMGTALSAGSYRLWCSLDGHEAAGMTTTVRVQ
jgi:hypothetical protein